jgi:hypothetical protein
MFLTSKWYTNDTPNYVLWPISSQSFGMDNKEKSDILHQDAVSIFTSSINSVLPHQMISKHLQVDNIQKTLEVEGRKYKLDNNVYVI